MQFFRKSRAFSLYYFFLLFVLYWKAPNFIGVSSVARFDLTRAIVEKHSFQIDDYVKNTIDWAKRDGHFYSVKAPGVSFLAVPIYWVFYKLQFARSGDSGLQENEVKNIRRVDLFVTALPSVLLSFLFLWFSFLRQPDAVFKNWLLTFAYGVATIVLPYSTMMWGHQTASLFLFLAVLFVFTERSPVGAGFFFSLAVLCEYSLASAAVAFLVWYLKSGSNRFRDSVYFALGGIPGLILFAYYHYSCFGGIFTMAYEFGNPLFSEPGNKLFGVIGLPIPEAIWGILFSLDRGIFVFSPFLLFSFFGFYSWLKKKKFRSEALFSLWIVFSIFWFNITFNGWNGGFAIGPRYLLPMFPYLCLSLIYLPKISRKFILLVILSGINILAATAVDVQMAPGIFVFKYAYKELLQNVWARNYFLQMSVVVTVLFAIVVHSPRRHK